MLTNFLTVTQQVAILFALIAVGFLSGKTKLLTEDAVPEMANFVLYIVTPCVMLQTFQREFDAQLLGQFLQAVAFGVITTLLNWLIACLTLHDADKRKERVYRFAAIFSNCGFMGLPLEAALLGPDGVFFGAAYLAVFNVATWTLGIFIMSGDKGAFSVRKLILNPGILGVVVGLALFFTSTTLPALLKTPIDYLAALNTPVPMVIIGFHLSNTRLKKLMRNARAWLAMILRLILFPLLGIGIGLLMGMDGVAFTACIIGLCAPSAAICTMFSVIYRQNTELSVSMVSMTSLLCIATMPMIIVLSQSLGGL